MKSDWTPRHLYRIKRGSYLCLCANSDRYSIQSLKLFIGPINRMRIITIDNISTDSKVTTIFTSEGTLSFSTPFSRIPPSWGMEGSLVKEINPSLYRFHIQENILILVRK